MRQKRRWIIIGIAAVTILIITAAIGGIVSAQTPTPTKTVGPGDNILARVAEKLGIEQSELEAAVREAIQETREEVMQARLQRLVDAGKLTQEQADEWLNWWQSRPEVPEGFNGWCGPGGQGKFKGQGKIQRGGFHCGPGWFNNSEAATPAPQS